MQEKKVPLNIEGADAKVIHYSYEGFKLNTLVITFAEKRRILATWEGYVEANRVGNMYVDGNLSEIIRLQFGEQVPINFQFEIVKKLLASTQTPTDDSVFLTTAVNMKHMAACEKSYKNLKVCCIATAGVKHNAIRMGVDKGPWIEKNEIYEVSSGTINIILLTNAKLSNGDMAAAIITATEAKTAALRHFDVRSTLTPQNQATGTGTDDVVVISGALTHDPQYSREHTKLLHELIAISTKNAVSKALINHDRMLLHPWIRKVTTSRISKFLLFHIPVSYRGFTKVKVCLH
ncbi:MAG: adenosylcobinamide amidohydrolase [Candidatus Bathyarchaeia archaeon]|jgi:adenosylcobinamide amidohydrolase